MIAEGVRISSEAGAFGACSGSTPLALITPICAPCGT